MTAKGATMLIWTQFSIYEVDEAAKMVRRIQGAKPPTDRVGTGWRPYSNIQAAVGTPAVILWDINKEGVWQMTAISNIVAIQTTESPLPGQEN